MWVFAWGLLWVEWERMGHGTGRQRSGIAREFREKPPNPCGVPFFEDQGDPNRARGKADVAANTGEFSPTHCPHSPHSPRHSVSRSCPIRTIDCAQRDDPDRFGPGMRQEKKRPDHIPGISWPGRRRRSDSGCNPGIGNSARLR